MMRLLILFALLCAPAVAQYGNMAGNNGRGYSSPENVDRDGDGWGTGPLTVVNTVSLTSMSAGTSTVSPVSMTGITTSTVLRIDPGPKQEFVTPSATTGSTFTVTLRTAHAAGVPIMDTGVFGADADDMDSTVHTASQALAKYGTMLGVVKKVVSYNYLDETQLSPTHIWYIAPAGSGASDSNSCEDDASHPCLTIAHVLPSVAADHVVMMRAGTYTELVYPVGGSATDHKVIYMAYPGERVTWDMNGTGYGVAWNTLDVSNFLIDGIRFGNAGNACINGGSSATSGSSTFQNVIIRHIEGFANCGLGTVNAANGLVNLMIEDSAMHDNDCSGGTCQHALYLATNEIVSSNVIVRRNVMNRNDWNGLHFNGRVTNLRVEQNIACGNGIAGLDFQMGVSNSYILSNLVCNNPTGIVWLNYPGACPGQGTYSSGHQICPYDQTNNLIENNTIFNTGNTPALNAGSSPQSCPAGINYCQATGIAINNTTSPLTGDMGHNTYRNNIVGVYGWSNHYAGITFGDAIGTQCDATCQGWASTTTIDHNLFWHTDGTTATGGKVVALAGGFGSGYDCTGAAAVVSLSSCLYGDPKFVSAAISDWQNQAKFDLRILNNSPALLAGSATGLPNYDLNGRIYRESVPSIGAVERNQWQINWNLLSGAKLQNDSDAGGSGLGNCPANNYGGSTGWQGINSGVPYQTTCHTNIDAWSGGFQRDGAGKAPRQCLFGSGHNDGLDASVYCVNVNAVSPTMSRLTNPGVYTVADWGNCPTGLPSSAPSSPNARHSANNMVYMPSIDQVFLNNGGVGCGNGSHFYDTWTFDFNSSSWTAKDAPDCTNHGFGSGCDLPRTRPRIRPLTPVRATTTIPTTIR